MRVLEGGDECRRRPPVSDLAQGVRDMDSRADVFIAQSVDKEIDTLAISKLTEAANRPPLRRLVPVGQGLSQRPDADTLAKLAEGDSRRNALAGQSRSPALGLSNGVSAASR